MPTYNYRCERCGILEVAQPITEPALETCPQCQGPVKRVIGKNVLVLFKGSGFYSTDSKHSLGATLGPPPDTSEDSDSAPSSGVVAKAAEKPAEKPADKPTETAAAKAPEKASGAAN